MQQKTNLNKTFEEQVLEYKDIFSSPNRSIGLTKRIIQQVKETTNRREGNISKLKMKKPTLLDEGRGKKTIEKNY